MYGFLFRRLQNAVFHLLRNKRPEEWTGGDREAVRRKEPLDYLVKIQVIYRLIAYFFDKIYLMYFVLIFKITTMIVIL